MKSFPDRDFCSFPGESIDLFYVFIFHRYTALGPVLIPVHNKIFMRPGTVDTDAAADLCIGRDLTSLLSKIEFFTALRIGIINGHETAPFIMNSLGDHPECSLRGIPVALHFFI